jgi:predicted nucleic acid-binding protein
MMLVDSTVYIDLMRAGQDPVSTAAPWVETGQLLCCGIIRCEVLRGIIDPEIHARMKELFDIAMDVPLTLELWQKTAELAWNLDRNGVVIPLTDLAIASCALSRNADVVTTDSHFRRVPGLRTRAAIPSLR